MSNPFRERYSIPWCKTHVVQLCDSILARYGHRIDMVSTSNPFVFRRNDIESTSIRPIISHWVPTQFWLSCSKTSSFSRQWNTHCSFAAMVVSEAFYGCHMMAVCDRRPRFVNLHSRRHNMTQKSGPIFSLAQCYSTCYRTLSQSWGYEAACVSKHLPLTNCVLKWQCILLFLERNLLNEKDISVKSKDELSCKNIPTRCVMLISWRLSEIWSANSRFAHL